MGAAAIDRGDDARAAAAPRAHPPHRGAVGKATFVQDVAVEWPVLEADALSTRHHARHRRHPTKGLSPAFPKRIEAADGPILS